MNEKEVDEVPIYLGVVPSSLTQSPGDKVVEVESRCVRNIRCAYVYVGR